MAGDLGTLGKLEGGISLASKGILSGWAPTGVNKLLMTDDLRIIHRNRIQFTDHWFWSHISDYYQGHANRTTLDVIWSAWELAADAMREDLSMREYSHVPSARTFIASRLKPLPLQLFFGSQAYFDAREIEIPDGAILCLPTPACNEDPAAGPLFFEYWIPAEFRNIDFLQEFLVKPQTELKVNVPGFPGSYVITSYKEDEKYGKILFLKDFYDIMWGTKYKLKSLTEMKSRFGGLVGHEPEWDGWFENDYFRDIYGLLYSFQYGPTYDSLELGLTIVNHFPYAPISGVVEVVESNELVMKDKYGNLHSVNNDTGQDFRHKVNGVWTNIVQGDVLSMYEILTKSVEVYTVVNNPAMMAMVPLSAYEARNTFLISFLCEPPEIKWTASYAFIERAKAYATKPFYGTFFEWVPQIVSLPTTYGLTPPLFSPRLTTTHGLMPPIAKCSIGTTYGKGSLCPGILMTTSWGITPPELRGNIATTYRIKAGALSLDRIQTTYGIAGFGATDT